MAISIEGTFDYVFDIAGDLRGSAIKGRVREPIERGARRLVGHAPLLSAADYHREPWQLYTRLTLTASDRSNALVGHASFSVDRCLADMLRPSDVLNVSRTACGGLGLSVLRGGSLIAAAGALTAVPLGPHAFARVPRDLVDEAENIFRSRDTRYRMRDSPVEISLLGETSILHAGRPQMGPFEVIVRHGFLDGVPGTDVSASIERRGVCPDTAAHTSAQLLEDEGLQIARD